MGVKKEIVLMRCNIPSIAPTWICRTGMHVEDTAVWDVLLTDLDVLVVNACNKYKVNVGTFMGRSVPTKITFSSFQNGWPVWQSNVNKHQQ